MHSDDVVISVRGLSKAYRLFDHPGDRIKQFFSFGLNRCHREFNALDDVSFDIRRGETVGIVGRNGSGKSTLLQLICGILKPTGGSVAVNGRISALLELGSGFNPEFTGRENVYFQGVLMGYTKAEMDDRFDAIAAFADIGEFIDHPVRTYSSGMYVRLAFAVHAMSDPDILIIDEALGVGDLFFQQKCLSHIRSLCDNGTTLLFVSHDTRTVRDFCGRALYLRSGRLMFSGDTPTALRSYFSEYGTPGNYQVRPNDAREGFQAVVSGDLPSHAVWTASPGTRGDRGARLVAVTVSDQNGSHGTSFRLGSVMKIRVHYLPSPDLQTHVNVELSNRYKQVVTSLGSSRLRLLPPRAQPGESLVFEMNLTLNLEAGEYAVVVTLGHPTAANRGESLDTSDPIGPIVVHWDYENDPVPFFGICGLPVSGLFEAPPRGEKE